MARKSIEFCPHYDTLFSECNVQAKAREILRNNGVGDAACGLELLASNPLPSTKEEASRSLGRKAIICGCYRRGALREVVAQKQAKSLECQAIREFLAQF